MKTLSLTPLTPLTTRHRRNVCVQKRTIKLRTISIPMIKIRFITMYPNHSFIHSTDYQMGTTAL